MPDIEFSACGELLYKGNCPTCKKPRVVVCAAIRNKKGKVVCGARHYDSVMRQIFIRNPNWFERVILRKSFVKDKDWYSCEQGFIDQFGVYMDRQEVWKVAEQSGQIKYAPEHSKGTLYSEDLY
jgi:hypothetical protein